MNRYFPGSPENHPLYLKNPSNLKTDIIYDPVTRQYIYTYNIGGIVYRLPIDLFL